MGRRNQRVKHSKDQMDEMGKVRGQELPTPCVGQVIRRDFHSPSSTHPHPLAIIFRGRRTQVPPTSCIGDIIRRYFYSPVLSAHVPRAKAQVPPPAPATIEPPHRVPIFRYPKRACTLLGIVATNLPQVYRKTIHQPTQTAWVQLQRKG